MSQGVTACVKCGRCFDPGLCPDCRPINYLIKPKVHDLQVNPLDLPNDDRLVLTLDEHGCTRNNKYFFDGKWLSRTTVIKWQEIPKW